jgi:hypothetical protein
MVQKRPNKASKPKIIEKFASLGQREKAGFIALVLVFAAGGVYLIGRSHAATSQFVAEAEQGSLSPNAQAIDDANASGGKSVLFGQTKGSATVTIDGIQYPNPLTLKNGNAVTGSSVWESVRRPELLADFHQYVYGESLPTPTKQTFSVAPTDYTNVKRKIVTVSITGPYGSKSFNANFFIPKGSSKPKGTFLMIDHRGAANDDPNQNGGYVPVQTITNAGYAIAVFNANDVAPDNNDSYRNGMINLFYQSGQDLPDNAAKAVGAWSWAASRVMDYLVTDTDIDPSKVAVIGHSRSGKASLWAGAQDTRFAVVIANDSGNTGAKLARRGDAGIGAETVSAINGNFPYWFADTYKAYNNNVNGLPVDQHELTSLIAPRRVVVASASGDNNGDPKGEYLGYSGAQPVYKLYGLGNGGLASSWPPASNTDLRGDAMSYHLRDGDHDLNATDWNLYLNGNLFAR